MTNVEKANEISEKYGVSKLVPTESECIAYSSAMKMAEWKDKQFAEEKKDLRSLVDMLPMNENNQTIIEVLKALLS